MNRPLWTRIILVYLAFNAAQLGFWALLAPKSFYDDFPGLGRAWISVDGPYNEHLTRDFGALNLALMVLLISAIVTMSRQLITTAALATLTWGVPHLLYHMFNTEPLETSDNVVSLGGLAFFVALPVVLLILAPKLNNERTAT